MVVDVGDHEKHGGHVGKLPQDICRLLHRLAEHSRAGRTRENFCCVRNNEREVCFLPTRVSKMAAFAAGKPPAGAREKVHEDSSSNLRGFHELNVAHATRDVGGPLGHAATPYGMYALKGPRQK